MARWRLLHISIICFLTKSNQNGVSKVFNVGRGDDHHYFSNKMKMGVTTN